MSSAVAVAFVVVVLVVGGLIAYAVYQWGRQLAISKKTRAELTTSEEYRRLSEMAVTAHGHRPETRRDQHAARPAARPAGSGAKSPQGRRVKAVSGIRILKRLSQKASRPMDHDTDDDRLEMAEQLAGHNLRTAAEAFSAIAGDGTVGDSLRSDAAGQLAKARPASRRGGLPRHP
jgi:hypothetical protein